MSGYINDWLCLKNAKKIAKYLNKKHAKTVVHEDIILDDLWNHPLYVDDMWLNVIWNDDDSVRECEVGYRGWLTDGS